MIRVIADPDVESALLGVTETAEIRGANGELLGYFCPASPETAHAYVVAAAAMDPKQISKRKASGEQAATTAEMLALLQSHKGR